MPADADPAVARLNQAGYARKRHCTAVAVAPRVALSAAHCLAGVPTDEFHILFGYARMGWVAQGRIAAAHDVGGDLAVLCLAEPAPATTGLGPPPAVGATAQVVGYGRPRVHVQQPRRCRVQATAADGMLLDCGAAEGDSGGPVLDAAGHVVGIVSRAGPAHSLAVPVPSDVAAVCER